MEKVPYSKSICSRLVFCNQRIIYILFLVSLWAVVITKERTLTPSPYVAAVELIPVSYKQPPPWKSEQITLYLFDSYFYIGQCRSKFFWKNLISHYFRPVVKKGPNSEKLHLQYSNCSDASFSFQVDDNWRMNCKS